MSSFLIPSNMPGQAVDQGKENVYPIEIVILHKQAYHGRWMQEYPLDNSKGDNMTIITSTTRRIVAIALTAIAIAVLMTIVFVGLHMTVASNHQSLHHAQDEVHLAINGGREPKADLALWGVRGPKADLARLGLWGGRNAELATMGVWGGRNADLAAIRFPIVGGWGGGSAELASATFRVPIWGGRIA